MKTKHVDNIKLNQIALIRHELHAPNIAMRGELQMAIESINSLINKEDELNPEILNQLNNISYNTKQALSHAILFSNIIENIFASFNEHHTLIYNKRVIDIRKIILDSQHIFSHLSQSKNIEFTNNNFEKHDFPKIEADKGQLSRVFINIYHNAIKYSYYGTNNKIRYIKTEISLQENNLEISISSYGTGILNDEISFIFQQGYRGRLSTDRHRVGLGLGLYQVKQIIEAHNGSTNITSKPVSNETQGAYLTKVSILLPYCKNEVKV